MKKSKAFEGSVSTQVEGDAEDESPSEPEPKPEPEPEPEPKQEPKRQVEPALQVCRYLLEMFSVPLVRSHATVSLVDRDRLQLYHANRSVILVSSAINFSDGDGLDKFIGMIIAFQHLSLEQNGILTSIVPGNIQLVSKTRHEKDPRVVQRGNELHLSRGNKAFKVQLGDVISRDPAMVGRSTLVLNATSKRWPGIPLVVKISWPTSGRISETDFLKEAKEQARGEHAWAANHLPHVYYSEDVVFDGDSTMESIAELFKEAGLVNGEYVYERRTLRIIVQERLYPLKSLASVKDIGQVFLDVACGTCVTLRPVRNSLPRSSQFITGCTRLPGSSTATSVSITSCVDFSRGRTPTERSR